MRNQYPRPASFLLLLTLIATCLAVGGCDAMNDNPTSADKMKDIRQKEADSRQNFHPSGAPPAGSTGGK